MKKVIEVDQGFGPSPYDLSQGLKIKREEIKYQKYVTEREVTDNERPRWGTTWYIEDEGGNLVYIANNWDTSG